MSIMHIIFGRLRPASFPFWEMLQDPTKTHLVNGSIATTAACIVLLAAAVVIFLITWFGKWKVLWSEWLTSVDHKRIGIMYIVIAFVMLARALIEAGLMRTQMAFGLGGGFLSTDHFGQLFTTHGTIMIFFMAMPFLTGVINYVMPLQIGARDVSFPVMNSISLGLTAAGAMIVMISLVIGKFSTGGWSGYPPYTEASFNPGPGVDYWIWALSLTGLGAMLTGINFAVTVYKKRAPGMRFLRMPLFTWAAVCTSIMMVFAMPPLTVATLLLALDRYLGFHFFPLYGVGLLGYPRRHLAYFDPTFQPFMVVALIGAVLVLVALASMVVQLLVSVRRRVPYAVPAGDPWDGRSLEWSVAAPPPAYNFAVLPTVTSIDTFTHAKETGAAYRVPEEYDDIVMPKNSTMGMIACVTGAFIAFGLVWHMWWLALLGLLAVVAAAIARGFARDVEFIVPAREVEEAHRRWLDIVAAAQPVSRNEEAVPANAGLAVHPLRDAAE